MEVKISCDIFKNTSNLIGNERNVIMAAYGKIKCGLK